MSRSSLLKAWFGSPVEFRRVWFSNTEEFLQQLSPFKTVIDKMMACPNDQVSYKDCWVGDDEPSLDEPHEMLADILALDQLPRTFYKKTPTMYSCDEKASNVAQTFITKGFLDKLTYEEERLFVLLTVQHSENKEIQAKSVELHQTYLPKLYPMISNYATSHAEVVGKFSRFPHRNAILNRESTQEEVEHLTSGKLFDWEKI